MFFSFGESEFERIEVDVLDYERRPTGSYWDDNWVKIKIHVNAGGFHGDVSASIRTDELERFLAELRRLYETLKGLAEFKTLEKQLTMSLSADRTGHVALKGELVDGHLQDHRLKFILRFDQTFLSKSIQELEKVVSQFPVLEGKR